MESITCDYRADYNDDKCNDRMIATPKNNYYTIARDYIDDGIFVIISK